MASPFSYPAKIRQFPVAKCIYNEVVKKLDSLEHTCLPAVVQANESRELREFQIVLLKAFEGFEV